VIIPIVASDTHFQKTTSESLTCDLTFSSVSKLNISRVRPAGAKVSNIQTRTADDTSKGYNILLGGVHNGGFGGKWNGGPRDIVVFGQVDDDSLVLAIDLFPNTYEVVGFQRQGLPRRKMDYINIECIEGLTRVTEVNRTSTLVN
jgi:hypothetical protein